MSKKVKGILCPIIEEELEHIAGTIKAKEVTFGSRLTNKEREDLYQFLKIRKLLDC